MKPLIIIIGLLMWQQAHAVPNKTDKAVVKSFVQYLKHENGNFSKSNVQYTTISYKKATLKATPVIAGKEKGFLYWTFENILSQKNYNATLLFIDETGNTLSYRLTETDDYYLFYKVCSNGKIKLQKRIAKD